jgi:hypothetical protein
LIVSNPLVYGKAESKEMDVENHKRAQQKQAHRPTRAVRLCCYTAVAV